MSDFSNIFVSDMDVTHSVDLATIHVTIYKPTSTVWLVNNMSLGPVEAITGEKSLPALTTRVLKRQVFGWVIK